MQFNANMLNITNFLLNAADAVWPIDITQHFVALITNDISEQMHANSYIHNTATVKADPFSQAISLPRALSAATGAEF